MAKFISKDSEIVSIIPCDLDDLKIDDVVCIEHAHTYKDGYHSNYSKTFYTFIKEEGGIYYFRNLDCKHTAFRFDPNGVFRGDRFLGKVKDKININT